MTGKECGEQSASGEQQEGYEGRTQDAQQQIIGAASRAHEDTILWFVSKSANSPGVQTWRTTKDRSPILQSPSPRLSPASWSISVEESPSAAPVFWSSPRS